MGAPLRDAQGALAGVASAGAHEGPLRQAVLALKFAGKVTLAEPLGELLAEAVETLQQEWRCDWAVPIPIHWTRRLLRGFNQSELIATAATRQLDLPLSTRALTRTRRQRPQVGLSGAERRENVRGAFRMAEPGVVAERRVLVVDDVVTTGATLDEAAMTLREAGAIVVYAATVTADYLPG